MGKKTQWGNRLEQKAHGTAQLWERLATSQVPCGVVFGSHWKAVPVPWIVTNSWELVLSGVDEAQFLIKIFSLSCSSVPSSSLLCVCVKRVKAPLLVDTATEGPGLYKSTWVWKEPKNLHFLPAPECCCLGSQAGDHCSWLQRSWGSFSCLCCFVSG